MFGEDEWDVLVFFATRTTKHMSDDWAANVLSRLDKIRKQLDKDKLTPAQFRAKVLAALERIQNDVKKSNHSNVTKRTRTRSEKLNVTKRKKSKK